MKKPKTEALKAHRDEDARDILKFLEMAIADRELEGVVMVRFWGDNYQLCKFGNVTDEDIALAACSAQAAFCERWAK